MKRPPETSLRIRARPGIQVIARAAAILRALEGQNGLSLGQLAKQVQLPRSTVQRIVAALDRENLVIAPTIKSHVRLGPALVRIARSVRFDIVEIARPFIEQLSRDTGETVDLTVFDGNKAVFVDQVQGSYRLIAVSEVGVSFPLHSTANGKAMLAIMQPEDLTRFRKNLAGVLNGKSAQIWRSLEREIVAIRSSGVAYDREQHSPGICAIGSPLIGPDAEIAAVSIPVPAIRFVEKEPELVRALRESCAALQHVLSSDARKT